MNKETAEKMAKLNARELDTDDAHDYLRCQLGVLTLGRKPSENTFHLKAYGPDWESAVKMLRR